MNPLGKEMKNSRVTFNFLDKDDHAPVGYKKITCCLIFYVKMYLHQITLSLGFLNLKVVVVMPQLFHEESDKQKMFSLTHPTQI